MSTRWLIPCLLTAALVPAESFVASTSAKPPDLPAQTRVICAPQYPQTPAEATLPQAAGAAAAELQKMLAPEVGGAEESSVPARRYPGGRELLHAMLFSLHPATMFLPVDDYIHCDDDEPFPVIEIGGFEFDTGRLFGGSPSEPRRDSMSCTDDESKGLFAQMLNSLPSGSLLLGGGMAEAATRARSEPAAAEPQVLINAMVVSFHPRDLGFWDVLRADRMGLHFVPLPGGPFAFPQVRDAQDWAAAFAALKESGQPDVLTRPQMLTVSGSQATVQIGSQPVSCNPQLRMDVLPTVEGSQIRLECALEVCKDDTSAGIALLGIPIPCSHKHHVQATAELREGQTLTVCSPMDTASGEYYLYTLTPAIIHSREELDRKIRRSCETCSPPGCPKELPTMKAAAGASEPSTCPYMRSRLTGILAAPPAEPESSVLDNLNKLERAAQLYQQAEFYQRLGFPATAMHCYEQVHRLCPASRYDEMATTHLEQLKQELHADVTNTGRPAGNGANSGGAEEQEQPSFSIRASAAPDLFGDVVELTAQILEAIRNALDIDVVGERPDVTLPSDRYLEHPPQYLPADPPLPLEVEQCLPEQPAVSTVAEQVDQLLVASQLALNVGRNAEARKLARQALALDRDAVAGHPLVYKLSLLKQLHIKAPRTTGVSAESKIDSKLRAAAAKLSAEQKAWLVGELLKRFEICFREGNYQDAEAMAKIGHALDPQNPALAAAIHIAHVPKHATLIRRASEASPRQLDRPAPVMEAPQTRRQADQKLERLLRKPVSINTTDMPLGIVLDDLHMLTGINIVVDNRGAGVNCNERVSLIMEDVSLQSALDLLTGQLHLAWVVRDDALIVTAQRTYTKTYPVANLLAAKAIENAPTLDESTPGEAHAERLMRLVTSTIWPGSWSARGGRGTIEYDEAGKSLVINQTPDVQEQVADLLATLDRSLQHEVMQETIGFLEHKMMKKTEEENAFVLFYQFALASLVEETTVPSRQGIEQVGDDRAAAPTLTPSLPPVDPQVVPDLEKVLDQSEETKPAGLSITVEESSSDAEHEEGGLDDWPAILRDNLLPILFVNPPERDLMLETEAPPMARESGAEWRELLEILHCGTCTELDTTAGHWRLRCQSPLGTILLDRGR